MIPSKRKLMGFIGITGYQLAIIGCCEGECRIQARNDWDERVVERCNWMVGKTVAEIEKHFLVVFPRDSNAEIAWGTNTSDDKITEIESQGCGSTCGVPEFQDSDASSIICVDGGIADAASIDRRYHCFDGGTGISEWICNNCTFGPEECCGATVWFLDQPDALSHVTKTRDCPVDTIQHKNGCGIEIQTVTEIVRRRGSLKYYSDPLLEDCH